MDFFENFVEYYDELFPVAESKIQFYENLQNNFTTPIKSLHLGSATGVLEHHLAKKGFDITGIEVSQPLLDSACLKRRTQLMSLRFFKLSTLLMGNVLGKNFYNVISALNDRIIFVKTKEAFETLISQCKELLTHDGIFIIQTHNYNKIKKENDFSILTRKSIRTSLESEINTIGNEFFITQTLETPNGKKVSISNNQKIYIPYSTEIEEIAKKYNYSKVEFFEDFENTPFTENSNELICILHA